MKFYLNENFDEDYDVQRSIDNVDQYFNEAKQNDILPIKEVINLLLITYNDCTIYDVMKIESKIKNN